MTGRKKGCYFAVVNQNSEKMNKSSNRPKDCRVSPQQTRASPICPVGRILFSTENSKLCAAALALLSVPHHHLAPLVQNPPKSDFPLRGRAVSIRQFQPMFHLKFDRTMDSQKKYSNNHGRKPKTDKIRHRYVFRLDDRDNARFLALFDESGKATRAEFIVSALFGREIKVVKLDKGTQDFYMRLTSFHSQFRSIGVNYNQCVRALKSNFSEKKALAFLYKLEQHTLELVELSKQISALVEEFQTKYPVR
jgi:hypothetical protein